MADILTTLALLWAYGALLALFVTLLLFVNVTDEDERSRVTARAVFLWPPFWPVLLVWWLSRGIASLWRTADWGNR